MLWYFPEKGFGLFFYPLTQEWYVPSSFEQGLQNWISFNFSFLYYHPLGKAWPFICANLNSIHSRTVCATLGWNRPISVRWCECFFAILWSSLRKGGALESPLPKNAFCNAKLKLAVFEKKLKMWISHTNRQIGGQMDDEQEAVRKVYFSFQVR